MQPRLFEEWIEKEYQQDANLCGACARNFSAIRKSNFLKGAKVALPRMQYNKAIK